MNNNELELNKHREKKYQGFIDQVNEVIRDINGDMLLNLKRLQVSREDKNLKPLTDFIVEKLDNLQKREDKAKDLKSSLVDQLKQIRINIQNLEVK